MNLFYYTEVKKDENENEVLVSGYSFNLDDVIVTYPSDEKDKLHVVLSMGVDKLNPVDYQYKKDPKTGQRYPVKVSKFEITNEPMIVELTVKEEITRFFEMTGGPIWE